MNGSTLGLFGRSIPAFIFWLLTATSGLVQSGQALAFNINPSQVTVQVGSTATVRVTEALGKVTVTSSAPGIASVS